MSTFACIFGDETYYPRATNIPPNPKKPYMKTQKYVQPSSKSLKKLQDVLRPLVPQDIKYKEMTNILRLLEAYLLEKEIL